MGKISSRKAAIVRVLTSNRPVVTRSVSHFKVVCVDKMVKTPCIGICSTTSVGDVICRGCKRFSFEVISWNAYTAEEKEAVLARIEQLVVQVMEPYFIINSMEGLQASLKSFSVPYDTALSPYCWLHNLLKKKHRELGNTSVEGVRVREAFADRTLSDLYEQADERLLALCEAHLSRYFHAVPNPTA